MRDQRPVPDATECHGLHLARRRGDRAGEAARPDDDPAVPEEDERVARVEPGAIAELREERRGERNPGDDGAQQPVWADHLDAPLGREPRAAAGAHPTGRLDRDVRGAADRALDRLAVVARKRALERRAARQRPRGVLRRDEPLLIRGECGVEAGLQARVHEPRLAVLRDGRKPGEGGRERQERKQQEIDDELQLEAAHRLSFKTPAPSADDPRESHRQRGYGA